MSAAPRHAAGWWNTLRARLILLALIGFLPLFGLAVYRAIDAREQALADARAMVARMAIQAERELAVHVQGTRQLLHGMAATPALRGTDFAACSAVLAAQLELGQRYATLNVAASDGRLLCHSDPAAAAANFADRDYFRRVLETRQAAIGKPVIGRASNLPLLPVAQPLLGASGEVQRVLAAGLALAWIGAEITDVLPSQDFIVVISDGEGRVLYRRPRNDKWFGHLDAQAPINQALRAKRAGEPFEAADLEGVVRVFAFAHARDFPDGSLVIRVGATRATLTQAADRELAAALAVLFIVGGLILFAVIAGTQKFVARPVAALADAAGRLGEGDLSVRAPEAEFRGELAALAIGFNRMAEALAAQMARATAVVEAAPDPIVIVNREGRIVVVNVRTEAVFGYSRTELLGQPVELLIPQRLHAAHVAQRDAYQEKPRARAMGAERELFARRKDGSEFAVDISLSPLVTPEGTLIISTVRDVTERKRTEQEIARQRAFLRQVIDLDRNFIFAKDREGRFTLVNQAVAEAYGTTVENLIGKTDHDFNPNREEVEHFRQDDIEVMDRLKDKFVPEEKITDASGAVRWLQTVKRPIVGADGRAEMILGVATDITERKQAEQRIRGQLEHLNLLDHITRAIGERQDLASIFQVVVRSLEDSLPVDFACVCLHDAAANALTVTSVGVKSEALAHELTMDVKASIDIDANGLGRCVQGQLVYEPDVSQVRFPFPERLVRGGLRSVVMAPLKSESRVFGVLVAARHQAQAFSSVECEFLRQLSEHVALAAHQAQLYGALRQAYDDLRQTQAAMMQEERLRVLGQMASGIAHDINNALSPVSLYTESMLETEKNLSDKARGYLETIQRAVEDVAQTVARMREFYRRREAQIELTPVQLNDLVQQVVELTKARWSNQPLQAGIVIRAATEPTPDLPKIMGVEGEIREALTNLVFNAVDAMPEGGKLTLRTRTVGAEPNRSVVVEVADTGAGMDEETRLRCLEPFFTTKGERGTGLGLAMVFGMVRRHSAEIEIESAPGAGTAVRLLFAVPAAIEAGAGRPSAEPKAPKRLRLLLVDDDPILLKSLRDALETDGHVIVSANGGEAGIAAFRMALDRNETFAAVITDLGMPYVDGRRVAAAVKELSPATPVILLTGWGRRLVSEGDIPPHVDRVLAKPPKLREVREALAQLCKPQAPAATT